MKHRPVTTLLASVLIPSLGVATWIAMSQHEPRPVDTVRPPVSTEGRGEHLSPALPGRRPNVLLIVTDDQRQEQLSTMPATRKWFQANGVTYRNAFATTPLCCPSRASIMTGRYAHNHRVWNNKSSERLRQDTTLQHRLQAVGFRTALVGKFLNGWPLWKDPRSFHRWAVLDPKKPRGYYNELFNLNGRTRKVAGYTTDIISQQARKFLEAFERHDRSPWFLMVAPFAPHEPYTPEAIYKASRVPAWNGSPTVSETDRSDKPAFIRREHAGLLDARGIHAAQLRTLRSVDDLVRALFRKLGRLAERRRTLAFFMSDNGLALAEHGVIRKGIPYAPAVRIPLYVRWPGHLPRGVSRRRLSANIDVAPTIFKAADIGADRTDGRGLWGRRPRRELLIEYRGWHETPSWASLLGLRYQYVEYYGTKGYRPHFREYYRLPSDPWQLRNVLRDGVGGNAPFHHVRRSQSRLERARRCFGSGCP
jgi:arylsulfatase A-like enzyme